MAEQYILQVTAGSGYDVKTHTVVPVNTAAPVRIESELMSVELNVRVQDYRGLPHSSPSTSPYFALAPHAKANDQYSIAFRFTPKQAVNGNDLVFGNDFDHPIRDRLPPGFSTALKIVKWAVDPGLDGDPYADKPYMYGPAASSVNLLHVGPKGKGKAGDKSASGSGEVDVELVGNNKAEDAGLVFEEGGDGEGLAHRREQGVPDGDAARKKFFLSEENRKAWTWEAGRAYGCDFFNPYLDFNDFALRLPGFTMPIMKYWDGQGLRKELKRSHTLRYVLKNRASGDVLFVVLFTLYLKDDIDAEGNVKPGVLDEANKPFELRDEDAKQKHAKRGWWWSGGDGAADDEEDEEEEEETEHEAGEAKEKSQVGNGKVGETTTGDDDVD